MADWDGVEPRECGEHRTTGTRAWCYNDVEWCYAHAPCRGCELPGLRDRLALLERINERMSWGWLPFGWHVNYGPLALEFDGEGEDGLPIWERVTR